MITRTIHRAGQSNTQLLPEVATPEGQLAGIRATSAINCSNLFTVSEQLLRRKIGQMPPHVMLQINECLKAALGIG